MKRFNPTGKKDTRSGFGDGLLEAAKKNEKIVALCADLTGSVKMDGFEKSYPERFIQTGIAEANMVAIAAGMAQSGKIPVVGTFAVFATGRVYDQIRQGVAYTNSNVKIAGSHAGITLGEDGATHQILEDIGLMKMLPNMVVINPCDYNQTKAATIAAMEHVGPVYLRFGRPVVPIFTEENPKFEIGKALKLIDGNDVTIIATGHLVWKSIEAVELLEERGISVDLINIHTIKPLDKEAILASAKKTGCVVVAEEHFIHGGLGESVAQLLSKEHPTAMEFVAIDDKFGESGTPEALMKQYHLEKEDIIEAVERVMARK